MPESLLRLGNEVLKLSCPSKPLCEEVARFINNDCAPISADAAATKIALESTKPGDAIAFLVAHGLSLHQGQLWLDASLLLSPQGKTILIAGASFSGKSTLTAALAIKSGFKIICEDITFINPGNNQAEPNAMPLSLRPGTAELMETQLGLQKIALFDGEWYYRPDLYQSDSMPLPFDFVCLLLADRNFSAATFSVQERNVQETLHALMPISNALRIEDGLNGLLRSITDSVCLTINAGSLSQRLDYLCQLAKDEPR